VVIEFVFLLIEKMNTSLTVLFLFLYTCMPAVHHNIGTKLATGKAKGEIQLHSLSK
jgi:hypothetical protein